MQVTLSQFAGFCDGVKRAFEMVMSIDMDKVKKPVFVLGSLVHNKEVVRRAEERGINKIERGTFFNSDTSQIGTIVITAHGDDPEVYSHAKENGIDVIDATCPNVIKVQRLAQSFARRGEVVVIVGDAEHKEVRSIHAWGDKKPFIVGGSSDLKRIVFPNDKKIVLLSQTTQNKKIVEEVFEELCRKNKKVDWINTICLATSQRQGEMERLAKENEAVVVIGGKESANSNQLFEISRAFNSKTFFVESAEEIEAEWFQDLEKVAVSAGASTPDWTIESVLQKLQGISKKA